ncbi:SDR family NAD(P)-dependent oxidoreductase [Paenarthrobacter aurescens]|uniref:SDR family NAD(P)-dependent oxidoreductase n=1 Tax=Paenarthrobacter aurescens TaxID=43663 RepID=UPI0035E6EDB9
MSTNALLAETTSRTPSDGPVALVTGGRGSIGRAVCERFRSRGLRVISADRVMQATGAVSSAEEGQVLYEANNQTGARDLIASLGPDIAIQHLVIAAGIYPESRLIQLDEDHWQECIDVNLTAVYRMIRSALPRLTSDASIVLVSSVAGQRGSRNHAHYATSKAGLFGLMRSVMWELGEQRRINAVSPGIIDNPMTMSLRSDAGEAILANTPLGRYGTPDEVAGAIDFLCTPAASFIHGENININGGLYVN